MVICLAIFIYIGTGIDHDGARATACDCNDEHFGNEASLYDLEYRKFINGQARDRSLAIATSKFLLDAMLEI